VTGVSYSRTLLAWVETALATLSATLFLLTLFWRDWIEAIFGVDPDRGDGSLELAIPVILVGCIVTFGLCARREWRVRRRIGDSPVTDGLTVFLGPKYNSRGGVG
jgi:hypothetical protein